MLLGALGLAGCGTEGAAGPGSADGGVVTPTPTPTPPPSPRSSLSPPPPAAAPTATPARLPSRVEIVSEFGDVRPTAFGLEVPGVMSRVPTDKVALTLDACGGPGAGGGVDLDLLALLRRLEVPATLFLNVRWIRAHSALAAELADDPLFELANHGHRHRPLTVGGRAAYGIRGTADAGAVFDEIDAATPWFVEHTGAPPRWFRSGTAHVDDVAAAIARRLGQPIAGFSVNADSGATAPRRAVARSMDGVRPGDVVIGHMNRPDGTTAEAMALALPRLLDRGLGFTLLTIP